MGIDALGSTLRLRHTLLMDDHIFSNNHARFVKDGRLQNK